jgi:hypothetical protein
VSLSTDARARSEVDPALPASPAATRHRRAAWKDPRLVIGVALVAVSALAGATLLGGGDPGTPVWVARTALAQGQRVDPADLVRREVRFPDAASARHYLPADQPLPDSAALARDVGAGELLPRGAVSAGGDSDLVHVPLTVPPTALPATVRVGSVVDVWVTPDPTRSEVVEEAQMVLQEVPVLHLTRVSGALATGTDRQVIVGVAPDQVGVLPTALAATATGTVVLTGIR